MSGGNWKDLLKAAGQGDLLLVDYHLSQGVDPNFQHPEYFTSPVFESIRGGHLEALKLLLSAGGSPSRVEESSDATPLEVALSEKQHGIVDFLISVLPEDQVRPYIKRVLLYGSKDCRCPIDTVNRLCTALLKGGHRLVLHRLVPEGGESSLIERLRISTGNDKIEFVSTLDQTDNVVDVLVYMAMEPTPERSLQDAIESMEASSVLGGESRVVLIHSSRQHDEVVTLLGRMPKRCAGIKFCDGWMEYLSYRWWIDSWVQSVAYLSITDDGAVWGRMHPYDAATKAKVQDAF